METKGAAEGDVLHRLRIGGRRARSEGDNWEVRRRSARGACICDSEPAAMAHLYLKAVGAFARVLPVASEILQEGVDDWQRDDVPDIVRVHQPREGHAHQLARRVEDGAARVARVDGRVDLHA